MKTASIVILAVLLIAAVSTGTYFYLQAGEKGTLLSKQSQEIEALNGRLSDTQDDNTQLKSENRRLKNSLSDSEQRITDLNNRLDDLQDQIIASEQSLQQAKASLQYNEARLKTACEERLAGLGDRLDTSDKRLSAAMIQNHQLRSSQDALRDALKTCNGDLEKTQTEQAYLNSEADSLQHEMTLLKEQLAAVKQENEMDKEREQKLRETYEHLVSELRTEIEDKNAVIEKEKEKLSVTFHDTILFELGQSDITASGEQTLLKVAGAIRNIKDEKIRISGHTDNIPIASYNRDRYPTNWELSSARACAVVRFLLDRVDLKTKNLEAVGHAYHQPIAANNTPEGRARNRRVEIAIYP